MSQPDAPDNNPLAPIIDLFKTAVDGFNKLENKEAYAGLVLVVILAAMLAAFLIGVEPVHIMIFLVVIAIIFLGFVILAGREARSSKLDQPEPDELPVSPPQKKDDPAPAQLERSYLTHLIREYDKLPLVLMDSREADRDKPPQLHDLFTPLDVEDRQPRPETSDPEKLLSLQEQDRRPRLSVLKAISQKESQKVCPVRRPRRR
jgi:hypothetical protein